MSFRKISFEINRFIFLFLACLSLTVEQGTRYVRLPSGFTFPESNNYLSKPDDSQNRPRNGPPVPQSPPRVQMVDITSSKSSQGEAEYAVSPPAPPVSTAAPPLLTTPEESGYAQLKQMMMKKIEEMQSNQKPEGAGGGGYHVTSSKDRNKVIENLHIQSSHISEDQKNKNLGNVLSTLGGGQFYQSIFGGRGGFSPLSFFLNAGAGRGQNSFFVPVPIVVPPPPPPPPGPKCYTNPSGFLCCNVTLEKTIEQSFEAVKQEGISLCNAQRMASAVQEAAEKKFGTSFETVVAHKDFVAKVNFAGDLNCKIEVDGKYILAYATPMKESEVNIIDANSFFSGDAEELFEGNGTEPGKPTYIVYGPI